MDEGCRIQRIFQLTGRNGDAHYGEMGIDQNEIRRDFTRLREHIASAGINYELRMP